jgi:hypothetical protein
VYVVVLYLLLDSFVLKGVDCNSPLINPYLRWGNIPLNVLKPEGDLEQA